MIDTHSIPVEIKVAADPAGGYRVWVHAGADGRLVLRVHQAQLYLHGHGRRGRRSTRSISRT